jgi:hypothetical protein
VFLMLDERKALDDLASGGCCCPCGGRLRPWGYARLRLIRQLDGSHTALRPRRLAVPYAGGPTSSYLPRRYRGGAIRWKRSALPC